MTTRDEIRNELRKRNYPQTAWMLRDKIGRTTVQLLCRVMAIDGEILERKYRGEFWYGTRADHFSRPYQLEGKPHREWRILRWCDTEQGGIALGSHWAKDGELLRLMSGERLVYEWNTQEIDAWRQGKKALLQLRKVLRDRSRSQSEALTRALTLRP